MINGSFSTSTFFHQWGTYFSFFSDALISLSTVFSLLFLTFLIFLFLPKQAWTALNWSYQYCCLFNFLNFCLLFSFVFLFLLSPFYSILFVFLNLSVHSFYFSCLFVSFLFYIILCWLPWVILEAAFAYPPIDTTAKLCVVICTWTK